MSTFFVNPIVTMWARLQNVEAEIKRVTDQYPVFHGQISSRRPGQPSGTAWVEWHRDDPDLPRKRGFPRSK
jgi:hypothetical protein